MGNDTPTVGHAIPGALTYRCDRIESTLPLAAYESFEVLPIHQPPHADPDGPALSDHCPAIATFTIEPTALDAPA